MVQLIVGQKGKGKTTELLAKANEDIKSASGNLVFLDKDSQHMYELNARIRLIDVFEFPIHSYEAFLGFLCGIISQDHDLEKIFLDSFLKNTKISDDSERIKEYIGQLEDISKLCGVDFILSVSKNKEELDPSLYEKILISL